MIVPPVEYGQHVAGLVWGGVSSEGAGRAARAGRCTRCRRLLFAFVWVGDVESKWCPPFVNFDDIMTGDVVLARGVPCLPPSTVAAWRDLEVGWGVLTSRLMHASDVCDALGGTPLPLPRATSSVSILSTEFDGGVVFPSRIEAHRLSDERMPRALGAKQRAAREAGMLRRDGDDGACVDLAAELDASDAAHERTVRAIAREFGWLRAWPNPAPSPGWREVFGCDVATWAATAGEPPPDGWLSDGTRAHMTPGDVRRAYGIDEPAEPWASRCVVGSRTAHRLFADDGLDPDMIRPGRVPHVPEREAPDDGLARFVALLLLGLLDRMSPWLGAMPARVLLGNLRAWVEGARRTLRADLERRGIVPPPEGAA